MSDLDRSRRLRELFDEGRELPQDQHARFCEQRASDDLELCSELEELLATARSDTQMVLDVPLLAHAIARPGADDGPAEAPPSIPGFRLLEVIGEGGMGTVYRAAQSEPVTRDVAIKVIAPGMSSRRVMARFEAERQTLARMRHPGIAEIHEAGTADDGRPWFAMEFVRGQPLTDWCNEQQLPVRERVRLFIRLCNAVQHAHQKGVIHRDLKPGNILVTDIDGEPAPKIIDFGIARAVEQTGDDAAELTQDHDVLGTPSYMSPEQLGGGTSDVDTRSDVFSLGVVLYELLCGGLPFSRRRDAPPRDAEATPRPPSTRVRQPDTAERIAATRAADPRTLHRALRGDLDWITLRALEPEPERRYASAAELATDLQRFLRDEPVEAGPPRLTYRLGKALRRHRVAVGAAAILLLSLVTFVVVVADYAVQADEQARVADAERVNALNRVYALHDEMWRAQAVASFFGLPEPNRQRHIELRLEILEAASPGYRREHARIVRGWNSTLNGYKAGLAELGAHVSRVDHGGDRVVKSAIASLLFNLGQRAADLGSPQVADPLLGKALSLSAEREPSDPILVRLRFHWLQSLLQQGPTQLETVEASTSRWLEDARANLLPEHGLILEVYRMARGAARLRRGDLQAAELDLGSARTSLGQVARGSAYHRETLAHTVRLAEVLDRPETAARHRRELSDLLVRGWEASEAHARTVVLPAHEPAWNALVALRGVSEDAERDLEGAAAEFTALIERSGVRGTPAAGVFGLHISLIANAAGNLHGWGAPGVLELARLAEQLLRPAPPETVSIAQDRALMILCLALLRDGDFAEAERVARRMIGRRHAYGSDSDFHHWIGHRYLAQCEDHRGLHEQAERRMLRALDGLLLNTGPNNSNFANTMFTMLRMWEQRDAVEGGIDKLHAAGLLGRPAVRERVEWWLRRNGREDLVPRILVETPATARRR